MKVPQNVSFLATPSSTDDHTAIRPWDCVHELRLLTTSTHTSDGTCTRSGAVQSSAGSSPAVHDDVLTKRESYRLRTFVDVWAYDHIVDARELARNGFFYAGPGDRVQCAFCQGRLRNWEPGDRIDEQHAKHFTYCRFVQGHDVGNVPIPFWPLVTKRSSDLESSADATDRREGELGIGCAVPKISFYARYLSSFATWPINHYVTPEMLARAGFYYAGNDYAARLLCRGTGVHGRTNCDSWEKYAQVVDVSAPNTSNTGLAVDPREVRARMDSKKVTDLLKMDYPSTTGLRLLLDVDLEEFLRRLAAVGSAHKRSRQLLNDAFRAHDEQQMAISVLNAAYFQSKTCIDAVQRCNAVRCWLSRRNTMLSPGSKNGDSAREASRKLPCNFYFVEENSAVRRHCTTKKRQSAVLLVALFVQLLGALTELRQWPGYHFGHFELGFTSTAERMGLLGRSEQGFTILLPDHWLSQLVHLQLILPQPTSCRPVNLLRSLGQASSWFRLAANVDFRRIDGFNDLQIQSSIDKPATFKLLVLHDSHLVDIPSTPLSLSSTANSQCDGTAETSDEDCKASADVMLHYEIADTLTGAAECDAELKIACDVNRFLAIKHGASLFTHRSVCVPAAEDVTRGLDGHWSCRNSRLRNVVVCTVKAQWGASTTSEQQPLGGNLQRLAQHTIGSGQTVFDLQLFRLASLASWPHLGKISALHCSSAGFYRKSAVGPKSAGDEVACFSCGCTVEHWTASMHPMSLHRYKCAQHCRFVAAPLSSANVPLGKHRIQIPISESTAGIVTAPSSVAASISSAVDQSSAADWMSVLGVRPLTPQAARAIGAYHEAGLAAIASGASLVEVLTATTTQTNGVQNSTLLARAAMPAHDDDLTKRESYRLSTFADDWAYDHIVDARELARNGFFYAGPGDRVQCAFCCGLLRNLEPGDRIDEQHAKHFTYCRFVQGHDVGNVPIPFWPLVTKRSSDLQSSADGTGPRLADGGAACILPKNPEFAIDARRLSTFATWPAAHHLQPEAYSRAGFLYLGEEDTVRCFFCGGSVVDWRAACDPWAEHFPRCPYLRLETGHDFVRLQRVNDELASSARSANASVDRRLYQEGLRPASSDSSASTSANRAHLLIESDSIVHPELSAEFVDGRTHLLHSGSPSSDFSASVPADSRVRQVLDEERRDASRSASVTADSRTHDLHDEQIPSTLTTSVSALGRAQQVHDEPASSTLRMSLALDSREVRARLDLNKVRIVLDMGYSSFLIRNAIQKRLATCGGYHETPEQLLDDVFLLDDEMHKTSSA